MSEDYYNILGVERTATPEDIKKAYRRLAHKHHPDKEGGDEEQFKRVNTAYQVLSDPQKRSRYDQVGSAEGGSGPFAGGFSQGGFDMNFSDLGGFADIFENMFTGSGTRRTRPRGQDISIDVEVSFIESAQGMKSDVTYRTYVVCSKCEGNGAKPGAKIITCKTCNGSGRTQQTQQTVFGVFAQHVTCTTCRGQGTYPEEKCPHCRGEGRVVENKTISLNIPAGIAEGQTIRISGKGQAAPRGGVAGDLYVQVHVTAHRVLQRRNNDVHVKEEVSFVDAILGTTLKVETLEGIKKVDIPAGTQPGATIRLAGLGFPDIEGRGKGDEIITVQVTVPKKISREQKTLLEKYKTTKPKKSFFG